MNAAESLAKAAMLNLASLLPCDPAKLAGATDEDACAAQFIAGFGKRAYRRPLGDDDSARLMAVYHAGRTAQDFFDRHPPGRRDDPAVAAVPLSRRAGAAALRRAGDVRPLDSYEMATRLSYLLWSSMPDDALFAAADAGELTTSDQIAAQVTRMIADPRAHGAVGHFNEQWLQLDEMASIEKDANAFRRSTPDRAADAARGAAVPRTLIWGQKGDLHALSPRRTAS